MSIEQRAIRRREEAVRIFLTGMGLWVSSVIALALSGAMV